jgi:methylaspartate ammonia-lyase
VLKKLRCEVVCNEWGLLLDPAPVPIFGQTGDARIRALQTDPGYRPTLHIDVYETVGLIFGNDFRKVTYYLALLEREAGPFPLYIERPVDMEEMPRQIAGLGAIRDELGTVSAPQ